MRTASHKARKRAVRALTAFSVLAMLLLPSAARAEIRGGFDLNLEHRVERFDIAGPARPRSRLEVNPETSGNDWNLESCKPAEFCLVIPIEFDHMGKKNGHRTYLSMLVPDPQPDYDIRFYLDRRQCTAAEQANTDPEFEPDCGDKILTGLVGRARKDKEAVLYETIIPDLDTGSYALGIHCWNEPCNATFRVTAELRVETGYVPPESIFGRFRGFTPFAPPQQDDSADDTRPTSAAPEPPPEVIRPGEDGPSRGMEIAGLAVGKQAEPPSNTMTTVTNIVLLSLLLIVLAVGGTMVTLRIKRDLRT